MSYRQDTSRRSQKFFAETRPYRSATHVMIGPDNRGRFWKMASYGRSGNWWVQTGWPCDDADITRYHAHEQMRAVMTTRTPASRSISQERAVNVLKSAATILEEILPVLTLTQAQATDIDEGMAKIETAIQLLQGERETPIQ